MRIKEIVDILEPEVWVPSPPTNADLRRIGLATSMLAMEPWGEFVTMWRTREVFVGRYAFALPSAETIAAISERTTRLVEVGAGTGFWSHLIGSAGVKIVATDAAVQETQQTIGSFAPVLTMEATEAVRAHPDHDVLSVWPSHGSGWLGQAAKAMEPGRLLFYIGEWDGCTADEATHAYLREAFEPVDVVAIPMFPGIHDALFVMRKR